MSEKSIIVAVYGSLRRGERANHFLQFSEYLGTDSVRGRLYDFGAWPGLIFDPSGDEIVVDVYSVDGETLADLDRYEGVDFGLFRQVKTNLTSSNQEVTCYEYCGNTSETERASVKDWTERKVA